MTTYVVDLHERAGALERLLNLCRRKGYPIHTLQFGPGGPGVRRVALELEADAPPAARVVANLAKLYDVASVEQVDRALHAEVAQATLPDAVRPATRAVRAA
ncbi:MAG: hypothetical protein H6732_06645 [Alphaproteobacteria bacterium]|nr:hypothetical protein [Alphaproteobacteria bacterium]